MANLDDGDAATTETTERAEPAPTQPATTEAAPTTVDPTTALRTEVEAAYRAAATAFNEASTGVPNPDLPALGLTHVDPMLRQSRNLLAVQRGDGLVGRTPPNSQYRIEIEAIDFPVVQNQTAAILMVCTVDDGELVQAATGHVVTAGVVTVQTEAAMRLIDGVWKLAERRELNRWAGVAGCAL